MLCCACKTAIRKSVKRGFKRHHKSTVQHRVTHFMDSSSQLSLSLSFFYLLSALWTWSTAIWIFNWKCLWCFQVFSIYLLIPGLAYCVVLHIDLLRHAKKQRNSFVSADVAEAGISSSSSSSNDGATTQLSPPQCTTTASHDESVVNGYAFNRGRHSGSFFLKIGAAGAFYLYFYFKEKIPNKNLVFNQ